MPPSRVVHVVLDLSIGGMQRLVEQMLRTPPVGFEASCLCLDEVGTLGNALLGDGFDVHPLGRRPGIDLRLPGRIAAFARSRGSRLIHCHQYTPWFYGILARLLRPSLRVVFTTHGRSYPDLPSPRRRIFNACMGPLTDRMTAVSPATAEALCQVEGFPRLRVEVIYNGVRDDALRAAGGRPALRAALHLPPDAVCFALACRFDPVKGLDGLVRALRRVVDQCPAARLILIGDGEVRSDLESLIHGLDLGRHVLLPGFRSDVPRWLAAADAFVLSSLDEGTSVSLLEAMAAGLPCIATRVGGNPLVVRHGETGLLVEPRDEPALAAAMLRLARDPVLRQEMGRKARHRFQERFAWAGMLDRYAQMYREALDLSIPRRSPDKSAASRPRTSPRPPARGRAATP